MSGERSAFRGVGDVALGLAVVLVTYAGWRLFWFLTDDAFIAFRYASNSVLGYGLVWNPPPFRPVEGYTSFLWVRLLEGVWRLTGVDPTRTANWLSLAFGYATLALVARTLLRMRLSPAIAPTRRVLLVLVLAGILSNRTFLTWLSSGLETAMFNFFVSAWIGLALAARRTPLPRTGPRDAWLLWLALVTALLALSRPDGLLFCGAFALIWWLRKRESSEVRWLALWPLLVVSIHLGWRRWTYGSWLPNTYYAKQVEAWAESGFRYLASFVLEYGIWVWLLLLGTWLIRVLRPSRRLAWASLRRHSIEAVALATLAAHAGYYTFIVGGDHFEYRVYSHLVPLLWISGAWLAARVVARSRGVIALLVVWLVVASPIPWVHWHETRDLTTRAQTLRSVQPIAMHFPAPLRPVVGAWDGWQAWLARRRVCVRHQEHKVFWQHQVRELPTRSEGSAIRWERRAVLVRGAVGVPGWVFPEVAVIDEFGLNDWVVARNPRPRYRTRRMAHDRIPPAGYVECFRPNLEIRDGVVSLEKRESPLSDEEIRACENADWN
ncbi:MAG: hypothetical protein V3T01_00875 [Myxococcota bacterium]